MSSCSVWCVGENDEGQFGLGHQKKQKQLFKCTWSDDIGIKKIYASNEYTIFEDIDGNYYSAGYNADAACTVGESSKHILSITPITCFKDKGIKVEEVFVSNRGDAPWWKDSDGTIYTSVSSNLDGRVGEEIDRKEIIHKISSLNQLAIRKIVPGDCCTIAICADGSVYSTGNGDENGDNGLGPKGTKNESWKRIECLPPIIDCDFGGGFVVFLSASGDVFTAGRNNCGQLGIGTKEACDEIIIRNPSKIDYFQKNNIFIKSIGCGLNNSVALDNNGCVYHWGQSMIDYSDILTPQRVKLEQKIKSIDVGFYHCILRSTKSEYISFGINTYNECCRDTNDRDPQLINEWILKRIHPQKILKVIAGKCATFILSSSTNDAQEEEEEEDKVDDIQSVIKEENKEYKETENENEDQNTVEAFLRNAGFVKYVQTFNENELKTMEEIRDLTKNDLKEELGIKALGHRKKIINLIEEYFIAESRTDLEEKSSDSTSEIDTANNPISLMKYAPSKPIKYVDNPLIIFFGIAKYQHSMYPELDDIHEDEEQFRDVFQKQLNYDFVSNNYTKEWNKSDAEDWITSIRKTVLLRDDVLRYNAIVFCGASHGSMYAMITSDSLELKVKDIRSLFAWNVNKKLGFLPKIFVFNCCRTKYQKPRNVTAESAAAGYSVSITGTEGDPVFGCKLSRCVASAFSENCDRKKDVHNILLTATKTAEEECGMNLRLQEHDIKIDDVKFVKNPKSRGSPSARKKYDRRQQCTSKKT